VERLEDKEAEMFAMVPLRIVGEWLMVVLVAGFLGYLVDRALMRRGGGLKRVSRS
jgi:hypothetical protein